MMLKVFTSTAKELVLLKRDRTGLLVLFIMPALLVMVITLVQENVMELTGQKKTQLLFLDLDKGEIGKSMRRQLEKGFIEIVEWDNREKDISAVRGAVIDGEYQVGIVIPEGSSLVFQDEISLLFQKKTEGGKRKTTAQIPVHLFFDPGIMPGARSGLTAQLLMALEAVSMDAKVESLNRELNSFLDKLGVPSNYVPLPISDLKNLIGQPLLTLSENGDSSAVQQVPPYNPVQQNVPAWALFGMFFTAIPIAGSILQERKSGIWIRLSSLPVSHVQLFSGKVLAYIGVCLCQFLLISLIGLFVFPYVGLPSFTVSQNLSAVFAIVFLSGLAACGYGIFLGAACNTYEQASTLGATTIVAAAAIGGVMVPVHAMPRIMQDVSIVSPLNWGLTAFHDLLVRGYSFSDVLDDFGRLVIFSLLSIFLAWKLTRTRL